MNTTETHSGSRIGLRGRVCAATLCLAALTLLAFPPNVSAVILMEVLEPLTLFEIEGLGFTASTPPPRGQAYALRTPRWAVQESSMCRANLTAVPRSRSTHAVVWIPGKRYASSSESRHCADPQPEGSLRSRPVAPL